MKTTKSLFILIKEEIAKALQPRTKATVPSGNLGAETTDRSISESINNLSQAMALLVGNRIASGFEIQASSPLSAMVSIMPGEAILNGQCVETTDVKNVIIEMTNLPKTIRLYLNSNLDVIQSASKRTDYLEIGKIVLPSASTSKIAQDFDETSNNGYIILTSDPLYDIDSRVDDETVSYFRNTLRQLLASSLVGNITLSEGLQIKNTQGTLEMDSKEIRIKSADNSTLAKFTRDGTFFYDANGQMFASYRKDGATIGNIKITGHSIESLNFVEGSAGFRIKDTGEVELENAKVRGEIIAESGTIGGWNIDSDKIISTNEQAELNSDGSIKLKNAVSYQLSFRPDGIFLKAKNFTVNHTPESSDDYISDVVIKKLDDTVIPDTKYYFESRTGLVVKKSAYANDDTFPDDIKIDYTLNKYEGATPAFVQYNYTSEEHSFVLTEFNIAIIDMDGKVDQKYIRNLKVGTLDIGDQSVSTTQKAIQAGYYSPGLGSYNISTWYDIVPMKIEFPVHEHGNLWIFFQSNIGINYDFSLEHGGVSIGIFVNDVEISFALNPCLEGSGSYNRVQSGWCGGSCDIEPTDNLVIQIKLRPGNPLTFWQSGFNYLFVTHFCR